MRCTLGILFVLICSLTAFAQDAQLKVQRTPWLYLGAYADYNHNIFDPSFSSFPNVFSCNSLYQSGTGQGIALGVLGELPLMNYLNFETRLGFTTLGGKLNNIELIGYTAQIGGTQKATDRVESQFELDATLQAFSIEPALNVMLFGKVRATIGFRAAFLMLSSYTQSETLVSPDYAFFVPDSSRVRDRSSGQIPNVNSTQIASVFGLGFDFPVGKKATLTPEVRYNLALNDLSDVRWSVSTLQFGVSFRYGLYKAPPPVISVDTVYKRDTLLVSRVSITEERVILRDSSVKSEETTTNVDDVAMVHRQVTIEEHYAHETPKLAELDLSVQAYGVGKDGSRSQVSSFVVEETEIEENFPLLPQVFFPEGSSDLNATRMAALSTPQTASFSEYSLPRNTLDVYHQLLNIVGSRMRQNESMKLTLVGCNNGVGVEKNNRDLSQKRAEVVRDYLINVWNIDPARFSVRSQALPSSPSNPVSPEGQQENSRVDLVASDFNLIKPVAIKDITVKANPPIVEIVPTVKSEAGLKAWKANIHQDAKLLREMKGSGTPGSYSWNVAEDPYPKLERPVTVQYSVTDESGQTKDAQTQMTVQQLSIRQKRFEQKDDKRIDRFSLIVFDFNKADLNSDNKKIVQDVQSRIQPNSTITIAGYADKSGEADYNRELARRRCYEVQKSVGLTDKNSTIQPIGSDTLLYDNSTPEGRAYCRTVQIVIETPVR